MKIYKIAQELSELPYHIFVYVNGRESQLVNNATKLPFEIMALSPEQAEVLTYKQYPHLRQKVRDYNEAGQRFEIKAKLNKEKADLMQKYKIQEEKDIQDAWWNK